LILMPVQTGHWRTCSYFNRSVDWKERN